MDSVKDKKWAREMMEAIKSNGGFAHGITRIEDGEARFYGIEFLNKGEEDFLKFSDLEEKSEASDMEITEEMKAERLMEEGERWRDVLEELPEDSEYRKDYLIVCHGDSGFYAVYSWYKGKWYVNSQCGCGQHETNLVTHWRELPRF